MQTVSASQSCKTSPSNASARILSEEGIKAWWIGGVKIVSVDQSWPALGSRMSWKAGGGTFRAEVTTDARPTFVEMHVETPSANSIVRHAFDQQHEGSTLYTKTVEPIWRSGFTRFLSPLLIPLLRASVKAEVKKACAYASR